MQPPRALWRRRADQWEYYSLLDWSWHDPPSGKEWWIPRPDQLRPLTPGEAAGWANDRQRWVQYWAWYLGPPLGPEERPRTIVRRRNSPERVLDEVFSINEEWAHTTAIVDFESVGRVSSPPHLVKTDHLTAERVLREISGIEGATEQL
jgi:hypothetical protein